MRQTLLLNVVVLGSFVLLFSSIYRRHRSDRLRFWIAGWMLAVAHFVASLWQPASTPLLALGQTFAFSTLMLCAVSFILSYCPPTLGHRRWAFALWLGLPCVALSASTAYGVAPPSLNLGIDLFGHAVAIATLWSFAGKSRSFALLGTVGIVACAVWSGASLWQPRSWAAIAIVLAELFLFSAVLVPSESSRFSAGVWTTRVGLLAWAAVFPTSLYMEGRWPSLAVDPEIWNVPKVVVAFGMLLTLFENEVLVVEREREQYRDLFDGNPLPMWIFDKETTALLEANATAVRDFGWTRSDLSSLTISDLLSEKEPSRAGLLELNWRFIEQQSRETGNNEAAVIAGNAISGQAMRFQTRSGKEVMAEVTLQRVRFHSREARLLVAKDVTAEIEAREQLVHLANHDPLTGLPNRLLLRDRIKSALAAAARHETKVAMVCMDLDRFKLINDTYGHAAGDSCLREIARRLQQRLRSVDTAARIGGEEFMILLDDIGSLDGAELVAADLLRLLSTPHTLDKWQIHLSASIGIALFPDDGEDPAHLWSMADAAMYEAKQSGGNRHHCSSRMV